MIVFEHNGDYIDDDGKSYNVFQHQGTHAVKVASVGKSFGLERAKEELLRRHGKTWSAKQHRWI